MQSGSTTVTGSGRDIWGPADSFEFASQSLVGDGQIVARVVSQQATDPWAKAGIMIRQGLTADSPSVLVAVTPANGLAFQRRFTVGGPTSHTSGAKASAPYWLKLVRLGDQFTAYQSPDGVSWRRISAVVIRMGATTRIGLAVSSHHDGVLSTAVFDQVAITAAGASGG